MLDLSSLTRVGGGGAPAAAVVVGHRQWAICEQAPCIVLEPQKCLVLKQEQCLSFGEYQLGNKHACVRTMTMSLVCTIALQHIPIANIGSS